MDEREQTSGVKFIGEEEVKRLERKWNPFRLRPEPLFSWAKESFSITETIRQLKGPFIEIGGPTLDGYEFVNFEDLDRKVFVSNIELGVRVYDVRTGEFLGYTGKIDFRADATKLPIKDGAVGTLFVSCLSGEIREQTISEASRVLESGGLLIWQEARDEDITTAKEYGFELVVYNFYDHRWDVIFQKKEEFHSQSKTGT